MSNEIKKAYDSGSITKASATPSEEALAHLNTAITEAHSAIESLIVLAEPHLPRHLFDMVPDAGDCDKVLAQRVYDHSDSLSRTVNRINSATNEVDRLRARIEFLQTYLVT